MATTTQIPVEVYLHSSYEPDAEYVNGIVEERPMGERDHAAWQKAILLWFWQHEKQWKVEGFPELRVQIAAARYRVPDITVLDRDAPREQVITHPPLAVFEVLSPEDTVQRLKQRLDDYVSMGIAEIWVIDPQDSSFCRYEDRQLLRKQSFGYAPKGIAFDVDQVKSLLD